MTKSPYKFEGLKEYLRFLKESELNPERFHAVFGSYDVKKRSKDPKAKAIRQKLFKFRYQEEIDRAIDGSDKITRQKLRKNSPPRVLILRTLYESMVRVSELVSLEVHVGDHQTATNSNHVAVMVATTLGRLMVLKDTLSPYFATVVDHTIF